MFYWLMKCIMVMAMPLLLVACSSTSEPVDVATLPVHEVTVKVDGVERGSPDSRFTLDHQDARVVRLVLAGTQHQNGDVATVERTDKPNAAGLSVVDFGRDKFYVYQNLHVHGLDVGNEDKEVLYGVFSKYTAHFVQPR